MNDVTTGARLARISNVGFQPSAFFQPPPKPSLCDRASGFYRAVYAFATTATGLSPLEESAWHRGKRQTSELANGKAIRFMIVSSPFFAVGGLFFVLGGVWWPLRVVFAVLIGLGIALAVALSISGFYALRAPSKQRDDAREYARALEMHVHDLAQWATRLQMAYDFRHDTLEDVRRISEENPRLAGSVADEKARWRSILTNFGVQIEVNGGDVSTMVEQQLAFLDDPEVLQNTFKGDEIAQIRNSMLPACQNALAMIRSEGPPTAPMPPTNGNTS